MTLLILYFCFTIGISATCSVFEAMLFSATPAFVESAAKQSRAGRLLQKFKANIDYSVGSILIVNMLANTIGAAAVGAQFVAVFGEQWQGAVAMMMTLSVLYIAEIVPKTIGAMYWKTLILPSCYVLIIFYYAVYPFVYISRVTTFFLKKKEAQKMSRDEILALMELAEQSGSLDELEMDILEHLMRQKSVKAGDIMTPKNLVFALGENESISNALAKSQQHAYSRIPLVSNLANLQDKNLTNLQDENSRSESSQNVNLQGKNSQNASNSLTTGENSPNSQSENLQNTNSPNSQSKNSPRSSNSNSNPNLNPNPLQLVYRQSILQANLTDKGEQNLKSIARQMRQVSENMQVMSLLKLFILCKEHLFAVVNERREFIGIVSLEDTINAIFGVGNLQRH